MKNSKLTKLVALASVLLVSVAALAGSTVAWFTDTETNLNTIQSGSLDIEWEVYDGEAGATFDDAKWKPIDENASLFKADALYEPGYTEIVYLRVKNVGNLDLKYKLDVKAWNAKVGLSKEEDPRPTKQNSKQLYLTDYLKVAALNMPEGSMPYADRASARKAIGCSYTVNGTETYYDADPYDLGESPVETDPKVISEMGTIKTGDTVAKLDTTTGRVVFGADNKPETVTADSYIVPLFGVTTETTGEGEDAVTTTTNNGYRLLAGQTVGADGTAIPGESDIIAVMLYMPEGVGNEANYVVLAKDDGTYDTQTHKPMIGLGLNLEAAQLTSEEDSFGDDYDEEATYADGSTSSAVEGGWVDGGSVESLQSALSSGVKKIRLTEDINATAQLLVEKGDEVIFDLNGHSYIMTAWPQTIFKLPDSGRAETLVVMDSSEEGKGTFATSSSNGSLYMTAFNNVIFRGGTYKAGYPKNAEITICNNIACTVTIEGGTFSDIITSEIASGSINVKGGTFKAGSTLQSEKSGPLNISGGTFEENVTVLNHNNRGEGLIKITGGTFGANNSFVNDETGEIAISGGTFGTGISFKNNQPGKITITGGTFGTGVSFANDGAGTISITGGTFADTPDSSNSTNYAYYVPATHKCSANGDGTYTVQAV